MPTRKLPVPARFTEPPVDSRDAEYLRELHRELTTWARDVGVQVNRLAEGQVEAHYNSLSATPSLTVVRQTGDIIRDNSPSEEGSAGSQYIRLGWLVTTDGTASTAAVVEIRALTGN